MNNSPYLLCNTPNRQAAEIIKKKIADSKPFSLTRYGDGEICLLRYDDNELRNRIYCKNWGYNQKQELSIALKDFRAMAIKTLQDTDMIGVLDRGANKDNILPAKKYPPERWAFPISFLKKHNVDTKNRLVCDHQITRHMEFGNIHNFKKILQGKSLQIISPNIELLKKREIDKLLGVKVYYTKISRSTSFRARGAELKYILKSIRAPVVIYGTGSGYKDLGNLIRDRRGSVVIDMGATLDAWSGLETRKWFRKGGKQYYLVIE